MYVIKSILGTEELNTASDVIAYKIARAKAASLGQLVFLYIRLPCGNLQYICAAS
jgi:hypothetical protein